MSLINFSGIASGIDSEALIDATSSARRAQRVTPKEDEISELEDENTGLEELKTLLNELKDLAEGFSSLGQGGLVKLGSSSDETVLTASASNSANNGTYSLTVTQLAKNATFSFKSSSTYTSASDAIGAGIVGSDTVDFTIGNGSDQETVQVTVDNTTTLDEFVTEFNSTSSKATASVVNIGSTSSPDYRIVVVTNNEGLQKGEISVSVGAAITADSAFNDNSVSQATNATFTMSGVGSGSGDTITRESNSFADLIPGLTINLQDTGTATITVGDDTAGTTANIQEFVDKYNEIVTYLNENNVVTREEDGEDVNNIFGPLAKTRVDDGVLTALRGDISGSSYSLGSTVRIFADLGITTERDGTLAFDSDDLEEAIANEPYSVKQILQNLGDAAALTGGTIDQYTRFNGLLDLVINGNNDLITSLNEQIARAEAQITQEEESLRARFARLESLIGNLQSQQSALTSALAGLQSN